MHLPEYYVTRSEHEIFKTQSETIIEALQQTRYLFWLDRACWWWFKTKELLRELDQGNYRLDYMPVDISQNALDNLEWI
jgi:uncharacterized SAM-dependent methyltransferase